MFRDIFKGIGWAIGSITGPIIGLSYDVIATTLGITVEMVIEAIKAGCETYEDIKDFHKL